MQSIMTPFPVSSTTNPHGFSLHTIATVFFFNHEFSRMHTGGNNLCGFVKIRGLLSANVIPQSVSSTTNLYGFSL